MFCEQERRKANRRERATPLGEERRLEETLRSHNFITSASTLRCVEKFFKRSQECQVEIVSRGRRIVGTGLWNQGRRS